MYAHVYMCVCMYMCTCVCARHSLTYAHVPGYTPTTPAGEHTLEVLVKLFDLALRGDQGCHDKLLRAIHMQTAHLLQ